MDSYSLIPSHAGGKLTILDFMPQGGSLSQTETALREVYGYVYYLAQGIGRRAQGEGKRTPVKYATHLTGQE